MKKFVIGTLCLMGLLVTLIGGANLAVDDKPEITSVGELI